ncbi:MAG TPA: serine hydrolase [Candidatus Anaerobutyricum stercoris]|uniref:Serine hydrolase n=1 Tax=Candidatus Anaerobutyricum stercoris TaxID=2838457 RepID=A0A9D2J849_9FIRM|nr:serine hydrolase [Candidatus Anaerobutyricum stercoris]
MRISSSVSEISFFTGSGKSMFSGSDEIPEGNINLNTLYSPYAVLVDLESGNVLAEQNSAVRMYPASLTKIMTALIAIEETEDMEQTTTLPSDIFPSLYEENASLAGFQPGETVTWKDLLYGVMLPSGAECCLTFARQIAGSEGAFVDLMNKKAEELGMNDTHFSNATGLQDKKHYSTVRDIAVLLRYALENDTFRQVFTARRYSVPPTVYHSEGFTFYNTMFQAMDNAGISDDDILGGKTGYTEKAGLCLASLAEINDREYILVTAKADGNHYTEPYHVIDAENVYGQIRKKV